MVRVISTIGPYTLVAKAGMLIVGKLNPPYFGGQSAQLGHKNKQKELIKLELT